MDTKNVLITGASSGIGRALALEMGRRGVHVLLAARREHALQEVAGILHDAGARADVVPLDVSDTEGTRKCLLELDDRLDGLDMVIANAGIAKVRRIHRTPWTDIEQTLQVNVLGATATLTALIPRMVERGRGHLVGVSSLGGRRPVPPMTSYTATKAYLSHLLEGLRLELAPRGLFVTDVQPGYVQSEINAGYKGTMPFLMKAEQAACIIANGLTEREPLIAFPWQLRSITGVARLLPEPVYAQVVKRMV